MKQLNNHQSQDQIVIFSIISIIHLMDQYFQIKIVVIRAIVVTIIQVIIRHVVQLQPVVHC